MKKIFSRLSAICILLLHARAAAAQTDVQNTGVLYMGAAVDTIFIGGSFTNTNTAALTNNSVLNIKQHISNSQAGMSAGSGTLYLNGTAAQTIGGGQVFKTWHLKTNNTAGITLSSDLSVSGVHTFINGLITTSATPNYMIYEAGSSYTGDNDSKHIYGWVKKLGNTDFVFPVGNNLYERTIALSSLGAVSEFAVKHNKAVTPNYTSLYSTLVLVDTSEYWTINRISGSSAVVTMNWDNAKIPVPQVMITAVKAAYWDGTFWKSIGGTATGATNSTGTVSSASTSAFNTSFAIGSTALVLPLQLISFTAQRSNAVNEIKWSVASESSIKNYQLQRSDDGVNFYTIATQNPYNNPIITAQYVYHDATFMNTKVYYRLQYNDAGSNKYSGIVSISASQDGSRDFYIVNNPVNNKIGLFAAAGCKGKYIYTLTAASGQVVQTGMIEITAAGIYSIALRNALASGVYILSMQDGQHTLQKTILKQ